MSSITKWPPVNADKIKGFVIEMPTAGKDGYVIAWNNSTQQWVLSAIGSASISDDAFAAGWNGETTTAPSQNAVYDKIAAMIADTAFGAGWNGVTNVSPSQNSVYDKIIALISDTAYGAGWNGVTDVAPSQNAVYDKFLAIEGAISALGTPLDWKGVIDCSSNPNYPAASAADVYIVSVAGKIGGGSGPDVEAGDMLICNTNNAGGTHAAVGSSWNIIQTNLTATLLGGLINTATAKTTPADADQFGFWDTVGLTLKQLSWSNIKSVLKTYFDTLYATTATVLSAFAAPTGSVSMNNQSLTNIKTASFYAEYDNGNSGSTKTIDWANGQNQKVTLTDDCTFTFSNPVVGHLQLRLIQDGTGSRDVTLPTATVLGTGPTYTDGAAGKTMILTFFYTGSAYLYQGTAWEA